MNKQLVIGSVAGALAVTAIAAVGGYRMLDKGNYAEVLAVEPSMKSVSVPRQECRDQLVTVQRPVKDPNQIAGTVAGAVIGGVLGNQVGGGSGKKIATVAGAAAGGYAGNQVQKNMQAKDTYTDVEQRCRTVNESKTKVIGYDVSYQLGDQAGKVHMDHRPGVRIPVKDGQLVLTEQPASEMPPR